MTTTEAGVSVSAIVEVAPVLTLATICIVTVVVLVSIGIVFILGVLFDCRHQKILEKKMALSKRLKNKRRVPVPLHPSDASSIVNNMEEPEQTIAPAEVISV